MSDSVLFTRENIDKYFNELAKAYKKAGGRTKVEIVIVGGVSVLINYDFRISSMDVDVDYSSVGSVFKDCINAVGDKFGLSNGWLNDDFRKTESYSHSIREFSKYYKTFCHILDVRTISAEYLVAMKLVSGRRYKNDLSDIAGIMYEQKLKGEPLTFEKVDKAVTELYGDWNKISDDVKEIFIQITNSKDLAKIYSELSNDERQAKETLKEIEKKYPNAVKESNVNDIIIAAKNKKNSR